ncbi:hypothetical protein BHE74_00024164 [Ensete ventricosum]|nr:hypothetical protein BHE74_00024164 [Ensete ventricosum]
MGLCRPITQARVRHRVRRVSLSLSLSLSVSLSLSRYNSFAFCLVVVLVRVLFAASVRKEGHRSISEMEQTFIMIKPDGVQRGLVGEIIGRFEKKGFYLKGLKMVSVERSFAEKHYADLSAKPFFAGLVEYIISGPVVAMVWEGKSVVVTGRKIIGATNPADSAPGTIRGDFAIEIGR